MRRSWSRHCTPCDSASRISKGPRSLSRDFPRGEIPSPGGKGAKGSKGDSGKNKGSGKGGSKKLVCYRYMEGACPKSKEDGPFDHRKATADEIAVHGGEPADDAPVDEADKDEEMDEDDDVADDQV